MTKQDFIKKYKQKRKQAEEFFNGEELSFLFYDIEPLLEEFLGISFDDK
jgi:hypothetical protein